MAAPAAPDEILDVNRRYHDVAAHDYDAKWGISFGEIGRHQVLGKVAKLLGERPGPFARSLEIGAGTGYFSLNLHAGRRDRRGHLHRHLARDARDAGGATPQQLGLEVETAACDAAALPFEDESFDLVLGHAVLHHLPDLDRAFAEFHRVLRARRDAVLRRRAVAPRRPDRGRAQARGAGGSRRVAARAAARGPRPPTATGRRDDHAAGGRWSTSTPSCPPTSSATPRGAGFGDVRVQGEELLANWFGWFNRTLEASADPKDIPLGLDPVRLPRLPRCCRRVDRRAARAAAAAAALLQPDARGRQAASLMAEPERPPPPSPLDMLRDPRAIVDTGLGPVAFVTVNALADLDTAAIVAVAISVRRRRRTGRSAASRSRTRSAACSAPGCASSSRCARGSASGYFVPRALQNAGLALAFAGLGAASSARSSASSPRRSTTSPAGGIRTRGCGGRSPRPRSPGSVLFGVRATVYTVLIAAGKEGALAGAVIVLGWPAFLGTLWFTYRYVPLPLQAARRRSHATRAPMSAAPPTPSRGGTRT